MYNSRRLMMGRVTITMAALSVVIWMALPAQAQLVELKFDTLPSAQGWTYTTSGAPESAIFSVDGATLHQNSLGTGSAFQAYILFGAVDPTKPFTVDVRARVLQSETFQLGGFSFGVFTGTEAFEVFMDTTTIQDALSTVLSTSIDTTIFHNYRLEGTPGGGYKVFVDGIQIANGTPRLGPFPSEIFIGDGTSDGNARADVTFFRFQQGMNYRLPFVGTYSITNGPTCGNGSQRHTGFTQEAIDYALPIIGKHGTPVLATEAGRVVCANCDPFAFPPHDLTGFGVYTVVEHSDGSRSFYAHLSQAIALTGEQVARGEVIALSGDSGKAHGHPHLHFQIQDAIDQPVRIRELPVTTWFSGNPDNPCNPKQGHPDGEATGLSVP
jgi:murein DD-endopeptidase MepM/ murein hydrolase activator NlpD